MHLQVCEGEEKERNTRVLARLTTEVVTEQPWATNASRSLPSSLLCHQGYLISFVDVNLWSGEQASETVDQWSCIGRGRIRFLRSDLHDYSLASSNSSPRLIYLFVGRTPKVIGFNANSVRPNVVFIWSSSSRNRKSRTVPPLKLCLTYSIYWSA
jgi:hypothetical protein